MWTQNHSQTQDHDQGLALAQTQTLTLDPKIWTRVDHLALTARIFIILFPLLLFHFLYPAYFLLNGQVGTMDLWKYM